MGTIFGPLESTLLLIQSVHLQTFEAIVVKSARHTKVQRLLGSLRRKAHLRPGLFHIRCTIYIYILFMFSKYNKRLNCFIYSNK